MSIARSELFEELDDAVVASECTKLDAYRSQFRLCGKTSYYL